jgi:hypothetical protein
MLGGVGEISLRATHEDRNLHHNESGGEESREEERSGARRRREEKERKCKESRGEEGKKGDSGDV